MGKEPQPWYGGYCADELHNEVRPHQGKENRPLIGKRPDDDEPLSEDEQIICHESLGEILRHYERVAARETSALDPTPCRSQFAAAQISKDRVSWLIEGNHQTL